MPGIIDQARTALAARNWDAAYDAFHRVDPDDLSPVDLEGLADAAWWRSRFDESIEARQRAYGAYAAAGDDVGAAATAARLSIEHFIRDRPAIGAGFLQRAERHAKHLPDGPGKGLLEMVRSNVARFQGDLDHAISLADRSLEIGERLGDRDVIAMALYARGLASIDAGLVPEGLASMDEAMVSVLTGELDPYFTGVIYCGLIAACLELGEVRRAGEWSDAAHTWCTTLQDDAPYPGMCAVNHAHVARLRGAWPQAEDEVSRAAARLLEIDPPLAGPALVQLGEVRLRRGDLAGAEEAFGRGRELGADPEPGSALTWAARGRVDDARAALETAIAAERQPARRARLLAALAEIAAASGALEEAAGAAAELRAIADDAGTAPLQALAQATDGVVAARADPHAALERLRPALAAYEELQLPYEAARVRAWIGRTLLACGERDQGELALRTAAGELRDLGAARDAAELEGLLSGSPALPDGLTAREAEVLKLVAAGRTNRDIAVELVISEHTVARHLQNMFAKLGVSSRAAATAYAFEHGLA
ncbi:MAG TPA: LuxR family transcriptional regulator [Actinomycetota bacterium]|nr:LuxR family transcriptional regulator [Actinomycetota bacterium]